MEEKIDIKMLDEKIQSMKKTAIEVSTLSDQFPALKRNTARILASLKMLELNVSDIIDL